MRVVLEGIAVDIDRLPIVEGVDLTAGPGELVGLIGPNGSGKSTLLRTIYRALRPRAGVVRLDEDSLWDDLAPRESGRRVGAVLQEHGGEFDFSAYEIVAMGRTPHKSLLAGDDAHDAAVISAALARVGMLDRSGRLFSTLSGGEKQRVLVARALAQETRVLVLDEPTNHLDISARFELLELLRGLELTTIAALHDLELAARYCDRLYVLAKGRLVGHGTVDEVLTDELVEKVFGVRVHYGGLTFAPLEGSR